MQQPLIDDDDDDCDDDHDDHDDPNATDGIYPCFLFHASSVWTQHSRRAPQSSRRTPLPSPSNNNVVDLAVGGWLLSLVFLLVVVVVVVVCYFVFGFFSPFYHPCNFYIWNKHFAFCFGWCFVFCLQVGGRDIQDNMNLQTVSTWYECTLYLVFF